MRRKNRERDVAYLAWLHTLPCCCNVGQGTCYGAIAAHHAGERGLGQKCPDREAISLCFGHHQDGPDAIHRIGRKFWDRHGLVKEELIAEFNRVYDLINAKDP